MDHLDVFRDLRPYDTGWRSTPLMILCFPTLNTLYSRIITNGTCVATCIDQYLLSNLPKMKIYPIQSAYFDENILIPLDSGHIMVMCQKCGILAQGYEYLS